MTLVEARQRFKHFSVHCKRGSPMYSWLSSQVADDDDVALLLTSAESSTAVAPLLFAAIQYLLYSDADEQLAQYFPTLGGNKRIDDGMWVQFREFLLRNADSVRAVISQRAIQTNEPGRAALLYPAIWLACQVVRQPVAILEVGCSAGLLLAVDRYAISYSFGEHVHLGVGPSARGLLKCEISGMRFPPLDRSVQVAERLGIDKVPVDVTDPDQKTWLKACIWADQPQRLATLEMAIKELNETKHSIIAGDAVENLAEAIRLLPANRPVVVVTSWTLPYMPKHYQTRFVNQLGRIAASRRLFWINNGPYEDGPVLISNDHSELAFSSTHQALLTIVTWQREAPSLKVLAQTDTFGARLTWIADDYATQLET